MNTKSTFVSYLWLLGLIASAIVAMSPLIALGANQINFTVVPALKAVCVPCSDTSHGQDSDLDHLSCVWRPSLFAHKRSDDKRRWKGVHPPCSLHGLRRRGKETRWIDLRDFVRMLNAIAMEDGNPRANSDFGLALFDSKQKENIK